MKIPTVISVTQTGKKVVQNPETRVRACTRVRAHARTDTQHPLPLKLNS